MKKTNILITFLLSIFLLINVSAFECNVCTPTTYLNQHTANTSIISNLLNLTLNFSQDIYYQNLYVDYLGRPSIVFDCFSFSNTVSSTFYNIIFNSSINLIGSINQSDLNICNTNGTSYAPPLITNGTNYTDARIQEGNGVVAFSDFCGNDLKPFKFDYQFGCTTYQNDNCDSRMFGNNVTSAFTYELLKEGFDYGRPIWAQSNTSCMFRAIKKSDKSENIILAWKVSSAGGQYCNIVGRWNWFVYKEASEYQQNRLLTDPHYRQISGFYDFTCGFVDPLITNENTRNNYFPKFFTIDFSKNINIVLIVLYLILTTVLILFKKYFIAASMIFLLGFIFLFSSVATIFSIICILGAIAVLFLDRLTR